MNPLLPLTILCALLGTAFSQLELQWTSPNALGWSSAGPNQAYRLEQSLSLETPDWQPTLSPDGVPGPALSDQITLSGDHGFYRVQSFPRGVLREASSVFEYNRLVLQFLLGLGGIDISAQYGVDVFRIQYDTVDAQNQATVASGIIAIPVGASGPRPLASIQRPTILERSEAPTENTTQQLQAVAMASLGYVTALPDLLGFGDSQGLHPYVHTKTSATAVVDMLRATRQWTALANIPLNDQLFLAGYSQGGHGTLAAHKMLQELHADEFTVTASAPMAGPYDLSGTMWDLILSPEPFDTPWYLPFTLFGYDEVYEFISDPSEILQPPYDTSLRPLFDGLNSGSTITAAMPASRVPADIFQPAYRAEMIGDPNHPLRQLLAANDLTNWTPQAPVRLFHCRGDTTVPIGNTDVAFANFMANGANVTRVTPDAAPAPALGHTDCAIPSLVSAVNWFDGFLAP